MSSMRYTSLGVMRPPKPPCWRDFVGSSPKSISLHSDGVDVADPVGRALGARSPITDVIEAPKVPASLPGTKSSRLVRRPRPRIHRTKSEYVIHPEDLPAPTITSTPTDTRPKALHVAVLEGPRYVEENNRRCQNWLAGILAAEPLDEVGYNGNHRPSLSSIDEISRDLNDNLDQLEPGFPRFVPRNIICNDEQQQEVDVEVPEETFVWDSSTITRHRPSSSDENKHQPRKDITTQKECEKAIEIPVSLRTISSTCSHVSFTSSAVYTACRPSSLTRCLVSNTSSSTSLKRSPVSPAYNRLSPAETSSEGSSDAATNIFHGDHNVQLETLCSTCRANLDNCSEKTHKIGRLCCDHRKALSSSDVDSDCPSHAVPNECNKTQLPCSDIQVEHPCSDIQVEDLCSDIQVEHLCSDIQAGDLCSDIQAGDVSSKDSRLSLNSINTKPSELFRKPKPPSDSELWALNLSTYD